MEKNLFEIATRNRYRFTYKGVMTVEDLWDLNVEALDAIFKALNRQKKTADEDSLLAAKSAEDTELANKIELVKYIVSKKRDKELEDMDVDQLMKKLEELN